MRCGNCHYLFFANVESYPHGVEAQFPTGDVCDHNWKWTLDLFGDLCLTEYYALKNGNAGQYETFQETLPTAIVGTNSNVLSKRVWLDRLSQQIVRWKSEEHQNNSIWLYEQLPADAGLRRVFIHNMTIDDTHLPTSGCNSVMSVPITVERHYCFESADGRSISYPKLSGIPNPIIGSIWNPEVEFAADPTSIDPDAIGGTEPSRICRFEYRHAPILTNVNLQTLWVGIKRDVGCGLDGWVSIWNAESGTLHNGSLVYTDSSAYAVPGVPPNPPQEVVANLNDQTLLKRLSICLKDVADSTKYNQFRGSYILLARVRVGGINPNGATDTSVSITARYGWLGAEQHTPTNVFAYIDQLEEKGLNEWRMVELGVIHLPPDSARVCDDLTLGNFCIDVEARRDRGDRNLDIDFLQLIPMEHYARVDIQSELIENFYATINIHEDDSTSAIGTTANGASSDVVYSVNSLYLPEVASRIVVATNSVYDVTNPASSGVVTNNVLDAFNAEINYFHRWLSLRNK